MRLGLSVIESVSALPEAAEYLCQRRADFHDPDARAAVDAAQGDAAERGAAAEPL